MSLINLFGLIIHIVNPQNTCNFQTVAIVKIRIIIPFPQNQILTKAKEKDTENNTFL